MEGVLTLFTHFPLMVEFPIMIAQYQDEENSASTVCVVQWHFIAYIDLWNHHFKMQS